MSETSALGSGAGASSTTPDLFTGTASHRIPVELPPGRAGVTPSVMLVYASGGGNGPVGVGWDLELGAIERGRKGLPDYTSGDDYQLRLAGGETVDLVAIGGGEYRARIESAFRRVRRLTAADGKAYWEVTDRLGTKNVYGASPATRQDNPSNTGQIFRWCLERVEDRNGNYATYTYSKADGAIFPSSIAYAANGSLPAPFQVLFSYATTRADAFQSYSTGFPVAANRLLVSVEVRSGPGRHSAFRLAYTPSTDTARSLLASVQRFGADAILGSDGSVTGGTSLPATTFTYTGGTVSGAGQVSGPSVYASGSNTADMARTIYADFDGDGRTDVAYVSSNSTSTQPITIWPSTGGGVGTPFSGPLVSLNTTSRDFTRTDLSRLKLGDFNGDGKTDILQVYGWGTTEAARLHLSTGRAFEPPRTGSASFYVGNTAASAQIDLGRIMTGDFNGDGKTDILWVGGWGATAPMRVYLSTGTDFAAPFNGPSHFVPADATGAWQSFTRIKLGDFNGDGKTDILVLEDSSPPRMTLHLSTGSGFQSLTLPTVCTINTTTYASGLVDASRVMVGDFNGDGMADLLVVQGWGSSLPMYAYLSTGAGFAPARVGPTSWVSADLNLALLDISRVKLGDFNGDGRTDIAVVDGWGNSAPMRLHLATENGFAAARSGPVRYVSNVQQYAEVDLARVALVDFDGDGRTDVAAIESTWTAAPVGMHLASGSAPDLLASVSNGIGGVTSLEYTPSTSYPNTQLPFPKAVVSKVTLSDGNGNTSVSNYSYWNGYYHFGDREFRGFGKVIVRGQAGPNGEVSQTDTYFHQGNAIAPWTDDPASSVGYMKGKPWAVVVWDAKTGASFTRTVTTYGPGSSSLPPYFNPPSDVSTVAGETQAGIETPGRTTRTTYLYDAYGNVAREDHYGDTASTLDDYTILRSFLANTSAWIVGLPASEVVYSGAGATPPLASDQIAATWTYYDGSTNATTCEPTGYSQVPTLGRPTRIVRWLNGTPVLPAQPEAWVGYDSYGNVTCSSDPDRRMTKYAYDATGTFRTQVTNALNHSQSTAYYGVGAEPAYGDAACPFGSLACGLYGQVKSVTDPNTASASTTYDLFGRKRTETLPDGSSTTWSYVLGAVGTSRVEATSSAGSWTASYLDGLGRTYWTRKKGSATGRVFAGVTRYNATGTVAKTSMPYLDTTGVVPADAALRWTSYAYDSQGRVTQTSLPDGTRTLACYRDYEGSSATIDANNHRRREERDVRGNRVKVQDYMGTFTTCSADLGTPYSTTRYEYDQFSRPTAVTDTANTRFETAYDTLGRKISQSDPDLGNWSYGYYASGDVQWQQDAKGNRISFEYDALHRVQAKRYPGGASVTYEYDDPLVAYSKGRPTKMTDASGVTTYEYDVMGRNTRRAQTIDGVWYTTVRAFDVAGRPSTVTYPDGSITANQYDPDGLLCKVSTSALDTGCARSPNYYSYAVFSGYNELGQLATASLGNAVTTSYGYYDATSRRLSSVASSGPAGSVMSLGFSYDGGGNVSTVSDGLDANRSQSFGYDELNRLVWSSSGSYGFNQYSYSAIGNILAKEGVSYTQYDPIKVHAVKATSDGRGYTYDSNGNMETETGPTPRTLTYDFDNRPVSITAGGVTTLLTYDGAGQRVKKQGPAGTTIYAGKLYECTGGVCTAHIFAGDQRIASVTGTSKRYYHADHLGSTRAVTNDVGAVVESLFYKPFGAAVADSAPGASKHKFTGQEFDPETGLYFYNARYYNPALGRFVSADVVVPGAGNPQAFNRYSYVLNSPLQYRDPSGHEPVTAGSFIATYIIPQACTANPLLCGAATVAAGTALLWDAAGRADLGKLERWSDTNWRRTWDNVGGAIHHAADWFGGLFGGGHKHSPPQPIIPLTAYSPARGPLLFSSGPTGPTLASESPTLQSVKLDSGAYGSITSVIYGNGEVRAYPSQTWGISENDDTTHVDTSPGQYLYRLGRHPMSNGTTRTPYPALNLYTLTGSRSLPGVRSDGEEPFVIGVNVHKGAGYATGGESGSTGCHVVPTQCWDAFIGNFRPGDSGKYYYFDLTDLTGGGP